MTQAKVAGVILAGGLARRMGGSDKAFIDLGGKPPVAHAIERLRPQVCALALNANVKPERYAAYDLPVIADPVEGFAGPLAGILAGLHWARDHVPSARWVVSVATDTPFFPRDLVARLLATVEGAGAQLARAASGGRAHPVFGLWPVSLAEDLQRALVDEDLRKIDRFTARYSLVTEEFPSELCDPFFNINRPEDVGRAERIIALCD